MDILNQLKNNNCWYNKNLNIKSITTDFEIGKINDIKKVLLFHKIKIYRKLSSLCQKYLRYLKIRESENKKWTINTKNKIDNNSITHKNNSKDNNNNNSLFETMKEWII